MNQAEIEALREEREANYGDCLGTHEATAKVWQGLLEQHFQAPLPGPIAPHMVAVLMASVKLVRMSHTPASGHVHKDNYDDAHGYVDIAYQLAEMAAPTLPPENAPDV